MKYTNDKFTLVLFVIYTIFYETLVWGLTASSIYYLQWQWPIIIVAVYMSSKQLKYKSFYIEVKSKDSKDSKKPKETNSETMELDLGKK